MYYENDDLYNKKVYKLYFDGLKSNELDHLIKSNNLEILSYYIDDIKYYARNIDELNKLYLKDMPIDKKIYYEEYGYIIDAVKLLCNKDDIIKLKKNIHIY